MRKEGFLAKLVKAKMNAGDIFRTRLGGRFDFGTPARSDRAGLKVAGALRLNTRTEIKSLP